jgi:hypothetical protein
MPYDEASGSTRQIERADRKRRGEGLSIAINNSIVAVNPKNRISSSIIRRASFISVDVTTYGLPQFQPNTIFI